MRKECEVAKTDYLYGPLRKKKATLSIKDARIGNLVLLGGAFWQVISV